MKNKRIVLTGGGTAGHVTPNIALLPRLQAQGFETLYIGSNNGIERDLIEQEGIPYYAVSAGKLRRYLDWRNLTDVFRVLLGFLQAWWRLLMLQPGLLISKGGFVSTPVVWAAWTLGIPVIAHESDFTPGLANKLTMPFVKRICYSFPETAKYLPADKAVLTGIPVREDLLKGDRDKARELLQFDDDKPVLLVIGGSQGAEAINQAVREALEDILADFNVVHVCGAGRTQDTLSSFAGYRQYEYLHDQLKHVLAITDVVISRAGATMLYELLALDKPMLLIPLSKASSRGDQILNARSFAEQGFAQVLEEEQLNRKALLKALKALMQERDTMTAKMAVADQGHALHRVLEVIEQVTGS